MTSLRYGDQHGRDSNDDQQQLYHPVRPNKPLCGLNAFGKIIILGMPVVDLLQAVGDLLYKVLDAAMLPVGDYCQPPSVITLLRCDPFTVKMQWCSNCWVRCLLCELLDPLHFLELWQQPMFDLMAALDLFEFLAVMKLITCGLTFRRRWRGGTLRCRMPQHISDSVAYVIATVTNDTEQGLLTGDTSHGFGPNVGE